MGKNLLKHWYKDSVPCRSACPADTDIPGYLEAIYNNEFDKAYQINFNDNFFPEILGRVCSRPCEDNCRHGDHDNGEPVSICFSKRAAGKFTSSKKVKLRDKQKNTNCTNVVASTLKRYARHAFGHASRRSLKIYSQNSN